MGVERNFKVGYYMKKRTTWVEKEKSIDDQNRKNNNV